MKDTRLFKWSKKLPAGLVIAGLAAAAIFPLKTYFSSRQGETATTSVAAAGMPWAMVGGCGAGGSGGGGGGVKWVGSGVSGGLIDVEVMYTATFGQNYRQKNVKTRLSGKPSYTTGLGLSIPVTSKVGNHQPQTNEAPRTEITGGLGDISIDWSKSFGMEGQYGLSLALTLPTGQWDIKRGPDNQKEYLASSLQKGGGIYSLSVGLSTTKDVIDGLWLYDLGISLPFNVNFKGKNQLIGGSSDDLQNLEIDQKYWSDEQKDRFEYVFKPYGESDLGAYTPPSLSGSVYYGYRGVDHFTHSWGLTVSIPLGVAWIPNFQANTYGPKPDPDHKAWSTTLNYGLEFAKPKYPMFVAVSLPLGDKANSPNPTDPFDEEPMKKWDAPDFDDFMQSWTVGIGVKSTMF